MQIPSSYRITILENSAYRVTGGVSLLRRAIAYSTHGEPLEWDPVGAAEPDLAPGVEYKLCRCGKSQNKPFCSDVCQENGFDGQLTADRGLSAARRRSLPAAAGFQILDDGILCADAGFCGTAYTNFRKMAPLSNDPEVRDRLLRMMSFCPSGRLVVQAADGTLLEPEFSPSIAVVQNGPLWVRGGISLQAPDGFVYEIRNRVTLCRCGQSRNKPFCDSTHSSTGFKD